MQISENEFLSENPHWVPNVAQDATPMRWHSNVI